MPDLSKRTIFSKILGQKRSNVIPPPYFGGKFDCNECDGKCTFVCERELLNLENGVVKFDASNIGCNFCEKCAIECPNEVLNLENGAFINANTVIDVNLCRSWNGVMCSSCQDVCGFRAIDFFGMLRPVINDKCTNCGECISSCFKSAISMNSKDCL